MGYELAWMTGGNSYALEKAPFQPGIDEELIAKAEAAKAETAEEAEATEAKAAMATALARIWTSGHQYRNSVLSAVQAIVDKAKLKQQAFDAACNPDICHCAGGKQHCHLNMHDASNARLIIRSPVQYCESCMTH